MNPFQRTKEDFESHLKASAFDELKANLKMGSRSEHPVLRIRKLSQFEREHWGGLILQLYFFQLFYAKEIILDLSPESFREGGFWAPRPIVYRFQPDFLAEIQNIYRGLFFNDPKLFQEGLKKLKIEHLEKSILSHFKNADKNAVRFTVSHLMKSMKGAMLGSLTNLTLPPKDALALALYLGFLYRTLSKLDVPLNVSNAFRRICSQ